MIVHLKTNNLSLCLNHEHLNLCSQKLVKNNHRKLHTFGIFKDYLKIIKDYLKIITEKIGNSKLKSRKVSMVMNYVA
jgi:hypothetical protein